MTEMHDNQQEPQIIEAQTAETQDVEPQDEPPVEIDLLNNGAVIKKIIRASPPNAVAPVKGQEVEVHYTGCLENGKKFDSSRDRDIPFSFALYEHEVIQGWDVAVSSMKVGERANFIIRSDYAYGENGNPPTIPKNATLHFDIELLSAQNRKKSKQSMSASEKLDTALELKATGNNHYVKGEISEALKSYEEAFDLLDTYEEFPDELKTDIANALYISCHLNLTRCQIKQKAYNSAIKTATKALKVEPKNPKALYLRGIARLYNEDLDEAKGDLLEAVAIEPNNHEIRSKLKELKEITRIKNMEQKKIFANMFDKLSQES